MAVNENLYSWMLKTYGMGAAEWYRSNPSKPSGANPFLPKGSYVPQAKNEAPGAKGPRGETLASVSPDIIEESIIEPAPGAQVPAETDDQRFERYYNESKQQLNIGNQTAPGEYATAGGLYYYPEFGEYGGYLTKENPDKAQVARVLDMMAQQRSGTADPSWAKQDLSGLITQTGAGGWHVRAANESDPEVQKFGIYNVGRSDYRDNRRNDAIAKNMEILQQQAASGNQNSQQFLDEYVSQPTEKQDIPQEGPRGEETAVARGPRGEDMGEIARNQGPSTPVKYDEDMKMFVPNQGGGRPANIRLKNPPVREAEAPVFDEQKALIAAQAAGSYRKRGDVEDPFRAAAVG
jgi:hypothetical protein